MDEATYRADERPSVTQLAKLLQMPPLHARHEWEKPPTPAMEFGTAVHTAILESDEFEYRYVAGPQVDRRTKAGKAAWAKCQAENEGKIVLSAEDHNRATTITGNVFDSEADAYLQRMDQVEVPLFGKLNGVPFKGRPDAFATSGVMRGVMVEIKTTSNMATRRNFELLGLPGEVTQGDVLDDALTLRTHDVVYSLGLIEHFEDFGAVARRHLRLLKPGGTLMLGVPNLRGINHWFRRRLAPRSLREHNLDAMDLDGWTPFENAERLEVVFKGYIGGLEPSVLSRCEAKTPRNLPARRMAKLLDVLLRKRCRFLRRFNSPRFSAYALGVYRKPGERREGRAS